MLLHPVNDKTSSSTKTNSYVSRSISGQARPQSAKGRLEGSRRQTISPRIFDMGRPGLGSRPQSSIPYLTARTRPVSARPSSASKPSPYILSDGTNHPVSRPGSARNSNFSHFSPLTPRSEQKPLFLRPGEYGDSQGKHSNRFSNTEINNNPVTSRNVSFNDRVTCYTDSNEEGSEDHEMDFKGNLSLQCCYKALKVAGEESIEGMFSSSVEVKKSCLLFLHDLVKYSTNEVHMELAKLGCIAKLVDFLRINDDDELLEITGLIISRMLISSDRRLCQLFNRHGGTNILMALLKKHPGTELTKEACSTLNSVNNVLHQAREDGTGDGKVSDVWEHIMQRWEVEDEVVKVLKQFIEK